MFGPPDVGARGGGGCTGWLWRLPWSWWAGRCQPSLIVVLVMVAAAGMVVGSLIVVLVMVAAPGILVVVWAPRCWGPGGGGCTGWLWRLPWSWWAGRCQPSLIVVLVMVAAAGMVVGSLIVVLVMVAAPGILVVVWAPRCWGPGGGGVRGGYGGCRGLGGPADASPA